MKSDFLIADVGLSNSIAAYNWTDMHESFSVDDKYKIFVEKYSKAVNIHIPSTTAPFIPKREPWITSEEIEATEKKLIIWQKYLLSGKNCHKTLRKQHKVACKNVTKVFKAAAYA